MRMGMKIAAKDNQNDSGYFTGSTDGSSGGWMGGIGMEARSSRGCRVEEVQGSRNQEEKQDGQASSREAHPQPGS